MAVWDGWLEALIAPLVQETPLAAELRRQPLPLWQAARVWAVTERVWAAAEGEGMLQALEASGVLRLSDAAWDAVVDLVGRAVRAGYVAGWRDGRLHAALGAASGDGAPDAPPAGCADGERS